MHGFVTLPLPCAFMLQILNESTVHLCNCADAKKDAAKDDFPVLQRTIAEHIMRARRELASIRGATEGSITHMLRLRPLVQAWADELLAACQPPTCTVAEFATRLSLDGTRLGLALDVLLNADAVTVASFGDSGLILLDPMWARNMIARLRTIKPDWSARRPLSLQYGLLLEDETLLRNVWFDEVTNGVSFAGFQRRQLLQLVVRLGFGFDLGGFGVTVLPDLGKRIPYEVDVSFRGAVRVLLGPQVPLQSDAGFLFDVHAAGNSFWVLFLAKCSAFIVPQVTFQDGVVMADGSSRAFVRFCLTKAILHVYCRGFRPEFLQSKLYWAARDLLCEKFPYVDTEKSLSKICHLCYSASPLYGRPLRSATAGKTFTCMHDGCDDAPLVVEGLLSRLPVVEDVEGPEDALTVSVGAVSLAGGAGVGGSVSSFASVAQDAFVALVIGSSSYHHRSIAAVPDCADCAREVASRVEEAGICGDRLVVVENGTVEGIARAVERCMLALAGRDNCHALVYYSGYGTADPGMLGMDTLLVPVDYASMTPPCKDGAWAA
jgi:hypothetical protein